MAKIIREYETEYEVGDVVIFEKNNALHIGVIDGYYVDDGCFWFNVRITPDFVYSYANGEDIGECEIVGVVTGVLANKCLDMVCAGFER